MYSCDCQHVRSLLNLYLLYLAYLKIVQKLVHCFFRQVLETAGRCYSLSATEVAQESWTK
jgi:hypothetical protein